MDGIGTAEARGEGNKLFKSINLFPVLHLHHLLVYLGFFFSFLLVVFPCSLFFFKKYQVLFLL